jgi:ABC-2 type transport system permease protein
VSALAWRIATQFRRDRRTLALLLLVPIVVLSLLGYFFRMETANIPLAVVNKDSVPEASPLGTVSIADRIIRELDATDEFEVTKISEGEIDSYLASGRAKAVIVFPEHYTRRALIGQRLEVQLILEGSKRDTNEKIVRYLSIAFPNALSRLGRPAGGAANIPDSGTYDIRVSYFYGSKDYDSLDYFAPAFIALFAFMFVFMLTSVSFLRERGQGTLERLMASPLSRAEIVVGYMLGFSLFALIQSLVILLFAVLILQIHYAGSLVIVFVVVMILTIGSVNLGIFLSTFARNELQVVQFIPLIIVPQALMSGIFWAVEDMPQFLQAIAYLMPLTYANNTLRDVMVKGYGLDAISVINNILVLLFFACLMVVVGAATLRREVG